MKKVESGMKNEFLNGITFEEDPFEGEAPESVRVFDLNGNEVDG